MKILQQAILCLSLHELSLSPMQQTEQDERTHSNMHAVVVRVEHGASIGVDSGGSQGQLMHARLAKDHPIRIQQAHHQR